MKCPKCRTEAAKNAGACTACGYRFDLDEPAPSVSAGSGAESAMKPLAGFRRTLSTEFVESQAELRVSKTLDALVESRTYEPGEVIIRKGDADRNLFLLTKGSVEISSEGEKGRLVLNVIHAPYILGDIAFLSGFPRTATAKARTKVEIYLLDYENLRALSKNFPQWLPPLLTAFASGVKSLHFQLEELRRSTTR